MNLMQDLEEMQPCIWPVHIIFMLFPRVDEHVKYTD